MNLLTVHFYYILVIREGYLLEFKELDVWQKSCIINKEFKFYFRKNSFLSFIDVFKFSMVPKYQQSIYIKKLKWIINCFSVKGCLLNFSVKKISQTLKCSSFSTFWWIDICYGSILTVCWQRDIGTKWSTAPPIHHHLQKIETNHAPGFCIRYILW